MSVLLQYYLFAGDPANLKKMHKKLLLGFSFFMIVALIAAVAGVGIAMGNYAKYSALEKELRGWFLKVSGIVKVNREIISNLFL